MAFTAVAAIATAETVTATMVLAAVAQVGTAMTIVGAVTGSKDLMKLGGTMALVGGIGGMAAGAMGAATDAAATTVLDEAASQAGADALSASLDQGANAMATGATDAATAQASADQLSSQLSNQAANQAAPITDAAVANNPSAVMQPGQPVANAMDNSAVRTAADAGVSNPAANDVVTPYDKGTSAAWGDPSAGKDTLTSIGANSSKNSSANFFTEFFKNTKPDTALNLAGNVLGGISKGYEADRNYQLGKDKLGLIQQQMAWGNSTPKYNFKA